MGEQLTPMEATYRDYREHVELLAECAAEALAEHPDVNANEFDAVNEVLNGDRWHTNYGFMLATVMLSDQNPDSPDYCASWATYCGLADPTWADAVGAMAYVCLYSDVMDAYKRNHESSEE